MELSNLDLKEMLNSKERQFKLKFEKEVLEYLIYEWNNFDYIDLHIVYLAQSIKNDHPDQWKKMLRTSFFKN